MEATSKVYRAVGNDLLVCCLLQSYFLFVFGPTYVVTRNPVLHCSAPLQFSTAGVSASVIVLLPRVKRFLKPHIMIFVLLPTKHKRQRPLQQPHHIRRLTLQACNPLNVILYP